MSIFWGIVAIIAFHVGIMWLFWAALAICGVGVFIDIAMLLSAMGG